MAVTIYWAILVAWPWPTSDDRLRVDYDRQPAITIVQPRLEHTLNKLFSNLEFSRPYGIIKDSQNRHMYLFSEWIQ